MTDPNLTSRPVLALVLAAATAACGGPPEPVGPLPTPAVHELARLQDQGSLDQQRLACSAIAVSETMVDLAPVLPTLWSASQPRWTTTGPSSHARSVQAGMAASDRSNAAMREATEARRSAAAAAERGDALWASRATTWAIAALRDAEGAPMPTSGSAVWRAPTRWTDDDTRVLERYADLFVQVSTTEGDEAEAARAELAEIGATSPQVMEAYAGLLLTAYEDPDVVCEPSES